MCSFSKGFLATFLSLLLVLTFMAAGCTPAATPESPTKPEPTPPGMINTALGPISPDKLGQTLVHEHFVGAYAGWYADSSVAPYDREAVLQALIPVCEAAKAAGIQTVIDATTNDMFRDPVLYRELSKQTGINIIFSTGLYTEANGAPAYWKAKIGADLSKMMSELFIKEITDGVGTTGIKPGVIKVASGPTMTAYEMAVHKAAVIAQKATGVPIITHTEGPTGGVEQAEFLLSQGADPKKVMIGHVSNSKDVNYQRAILQKGVSIAFDRLGIAVWLGVPDSVSVQNIATLCQEGYANKIMLSTDNTRFWIARYTYADAPQAIVQGLDKVTIDYISKNIIPALKAQGVTDDQINAMMVENPKNLFLGK
jgi:phosphotriesterase-related protein